MAAIGAGLVLLVGVEQGDEEADVDAAAAKIVGLRIFEDDDGRMNRSLADVRGSILVISQFTLLADVRRGRRPSFTRAANPDVAAPLVARFVESLRASGIVTETGVFGAQMKVSLINDGPVTVVIATSRGKVV